jgi:glycosyltransferase involved in cell wall biosynthesis
MKGSRLSINFSIVISARNAEETIGRAIKSVMDQRGMDRFPIILVDHGSTDATVRIVHEIGDGRVTVIPADGNLSLGAVRKLGLAAVRTEFGAWLDADDEMYPERCGKLLKQLTTKDADLVFDDVELCSGATGVVLNRLMVPPFIKRTVDFVRNFERNFIPGPGVPAFRTDFARRIGYDMSLTAGEDVDFLLRSVAAGGRLVAARETLYRQFGYEGSTSRDLRHQRAQLACLLKKHAYHSVQKRYRAAGYDERVALWGVFSMALFRDDYTVAKSFLDTLQALSDDRNAFLEPDGPYPICEGWRIDFARGTLALLLDSLGDMAVAVEALSSAIRQVERADAMNNLGVALRRLGRNDEAIQMFRRALEFFPGYLDSRNNLVDAGSSSVTSHPLRFYPSRNEY